MLSFEQILYEAEPLEGEDLFDYLNNVFVAENFDDYLIDKRADSDEIESIRMMFDDNCSLKERANMILRDDPYCIEAFFVAYSINEPLVVHSILSSLENYSFMFEELTVYKKEVYKSELNIYIQYLTEVHNLKKAIRIVKLLVELEAVYSVLNVNRLIYLYCLLEDLDSMYQLYEDVGFSDAISYLLMMITAIKLERYEVAKEVYNELLSKYEYAKYLDRPKALLNIDDEEARYFYNAIEMASEEMLAVPNFFLWCANNRERRMFS
ncbi:MAG: hypothetical protein Q4B60_00830 [Erysipelotrichaceae bacterium]|nr:hypothetical protein [Erysipelotrichaceae bacterium]